MRSFLTKLLIKYRVVVFKKESLEELGSFYVHKIHIAICFFLILALCFFLCSLSLLFSPLGNALFDYSKKKEISELYLHVDSIDNLLNLHLDYTENLKLIFNELDSSTEKKENSLILQPII